MRLHVRGFSTRDVVRRCEAHALGSRRSGTAWLVAPEASTFCAGDDEGVKNTRFLCSSPVLRGEDGGGSVKSTVGKVVSTLLSSPKGGVVKGESTKIGTAKQRTSSELISGGAKRLSSSRAPIKGSTKRLSSSIISSPKGKASKIRPTTRRTLLALGGRRIVIEGFGSNSPIFLAIGGNGEAPAGAWLSPAVLRHFIEVAIRILK